MSQESRFGGGEDTTCAYFEQLVRKRLSWQGIYIKMRPDNCACVAGGTGRVSARKDCLPPMASGGFCLRGTIKNRENARKKRGREHEKTMAQHGSYPVPDTGAGAGFGGLRPVRRERHSR